MPAFTPKPLSVTALWSEPVFRPAELAWAAGYKPRWCIRPQTVTHPSTNRSATRFEQVGAISTCRDSSNLLEPGRRRFEAKFHYAIWSQTGPKLVADRPEAGRRQVRGWSQTC